MRFLSCFRYYVIIGRATEWNEASIHTVTLQHPVSLNTSIRHRSAPHKLVAVGTSLLLLPWLHSSCLPWQSHSLGFLRCRQQHGIISTCINSRQPRDQQQYACLVPRTTEAELPGLCQPGGWQLQKSRWHPYLAVTMMPA